MGCCWKILNVLISETSKLRKKCKMHLLSLSCQTELVLKPQLMKKLKTNIFISIFSLEWNEPSFLFYFIILSQLSKMPLLKSTFFSDAVTQWNMIPAHTFLSLLSFSILISSDFCWGQDSTEVCTYLCACSLLCFMSPCWYLATDLFSSWTSSTGVPRWTCSTFRTFWTIFSSWTWLTNFSLKHTTS